MSGRVCGSDPAAEMIQAAGLQLSSWEVVLRSPELEVEKSS